jgi:hypothetical protein
MKSLFEIRQDAMFVELQKIANGDMMQYFQDNPQKLKEYLARKAAKEKKKGLTKTAEPTEKQKHAGNYKMKHIRYNGMEISIENPAGSVRRGVGHGGKAWANKMLNHYGYIRKTMGKDGDHVDVFIKPGTTETEKVYIINQVNPGKRDFDEHKCMLGFTSESAARAGYLSSYDKGWTGIGSVAVMPIADFKKWVYSGDRTKPAKSVEVKEMKKAAMMGPGQMSGPMSMPPNPAMVKSTTPPIVHGSANPQNKMLPSPAMPNQISKTAEDAYNEAFVDELEKISGKKFDTIKKWFSNKVENQLKSMAKGLREAEKKSMSLKKKINIEKNASALGMIGSVAKRAWTPLSKSRHSIDRAKGLRKGLEKAVGEKSSLINKQKSLQSNVSKFQSKGVGEGFFGNTFGARRTRLQNLRTARKSNREFGRSANKRFGDVKKRISGYESQIGADVLADKGRSAVNTAARVGIVGGGTILASGPVSRAVNKIRSNNNQSSYYR